MNIEKKKLTETYSLNSLNKKTLLYVMFHVCRHLIWYYLEQNLTCRQIMKYMSLCALLISD